MTESERVIRQEEGLTVVYVIIPSEGQVSRYEETAEKDKNGLAIYQYTGQVPGVPDPDWRYPEA